MIVFVGFAVQEHPSADARALRQRQHFQHGDAQRRTLGHACATSKIEVFLYNEESQSEVILQNTARSISLCVGERT